MSNLIENPSFNNRHRHYYQGSNGNIYDADEVECNNDGCHVKDTEIEANLISELQIPNSWDITWIESEINPLPDGWPLLRPEINNGNVEQLPAIPITWDDRYSHTTERELFADGDKYLKIFKGGGALHWWIDSDFINVEYGKKYTIVFRVFPDLVTGYANGKKVWATDRPGDVKLETSIHDGEWVEIVAGEWNEFGLTFVATANTPIFIKFSARCRWAIQNNGWFLDTVSMYEVPNTDIPEPPRIKQTIHLIPQDTIQAEMDWLTRELSPTKSAFTYSADLAHAVVYTGNDESKVIVWSGDRWQDDIYNWLDSRNIPYESREFPDSI